MPHEVPADVAYEAAVERAVRTTRALILAEAQVATLERRVAELEADGRALRARLADYADEGVKHDGAEDGAGAGGAEGEVGQPHPFHD